MRTADLRTASDADWAEAHRREKIIRPLASVTRVPGDVAAQAMVQLELGRARFHKLLQLYRASPAVASLLPRPRGREKGEQAPLRVRVGLHHSRTGLDVADILAQFHAWLAE